MHEVESYTAGIEGYAYIIVMVVIYVIKQVLKMKKKPTVKPYVPETPNSEPVVKEENRPVFHEEVSDEWSYAPDLGYDSNEDKEQELERAISESNGDLYNALSKIQSEKSVEVIDDQQTTERYKEFKLQEKPNNKFADMFNDPDNLKNAFVLSEVLKRKF